MTIQYKKTKSAALSFGDRSRQIKTPAFWSVIKDGEHIANIIGSSCGAFSKPEYTLVTPYGAVIKLLTGKSLTEVKAWIERSL